MSNPFSLGHLVEGVVEQDPITDQFTIRTPEGISFDVQAALGELKGQAVRFTLVSFETLQKLAELVETSGGGQVVGVGLVGNRK
jgi:hypothetical protein